MTFGHMVEINRLAYFYGNNVPISTTTLIQIACSLIRVKKNKLGHCSEMDTQHGIRNNPHVLVMQIPTEQSGTRSSIGSGYSLMFSPISSHTNHNKVHGFTNQGQTASNQTKISDNNTNIHPGTRVNNVQPASVHVQAKISGRYPSTDTNIQPLSNHTTATCISALHANSSRPIVIPKSQQATIHETQRFTALIESTAPTTHNQHIVPSGVAKMQKIPRVTYMKQPVGATCHSVNNPIRPPFGPRGPTSRHPRSVHTPQTNYREPPNQQDNINVNMKRKTCHVQHHQLNNDDQERLEKRDASNTVHIDQHHSTKRTIANFCDDGKMNKLAPQFQKNEHGDDLTTNVIGATGQSICTNSTENTAHPFPNQHSLFPIVAFVKRLWDMVNDDHMICHWDATGIIVLLDMVMYELHMLRTINDKGMKLVKSNNFEAFHKVLISHGFNHVRGNNNDIFTALELNKILQTKPTLAAYYHPCFQRDRPDLICRISKVSADTGTMHISKDTFGFLPATELAAQMNTTHNTPKRRRTSDGYESELSNDLKEVESVCVKHSKKYQHVHERNPTMVFVAHCVTKSGLFPVFATPASIGLSKTPHDKKHENINSVMASRCECHKRDKNKDTQPTAASKQTANGMRTDEAIQTDAAMQTDDTEVEVINKRSM